MLNLQYSKALSVWFTSYVRSAPYHCRRVIIANTGIEMSSSQKPASGIQTAFLRYLWCMQTIVCSLCFSIANSNTSFGLQEERLIELENLIRGSERPKAIQKYLRQLYDEFHTERQLEMIIVSSLDGLATQTKWQIGLSNIKSKDDLSAQRQHVAGFIGWLEGRYSIIAPSEWKQALISCRFERRNVLKFEQGQEFPFVKASNAWYVLGGDNIVELDGSLRYKSKSGIDVPIAKEIVEYSMGLNKHQTAVHFLELANQSSGVMSIQGGSLSKFPLFNVDKKTGKTVWKTEVLTGVEVVLGFSVHGIRHRVFLIEKNGQLFVFGYGFLKGFVECLDLETGNAKWRFSTSYALQKLHADGKAKKNN